MSGLPDAALERLAKLCNEERVSLQDLFSRDRTVPLPRARRVAWFVLYDEFDWSFPAIGKLFGGRDHTTILQGVYKGAVELGLVGWRARPPMGVRRAREPESAQLTLIDVTGTR